MTPPPTETPALALDPAALDTLRRTLIDALPHRPNATEAHKAAKRDVALGMLAALRPRDPMEVMLVTRIILADFHAVDCFVAAARADVPEALQLRHRARAVALMRLQDVADRALTKRRADEAFRAMRAAGPVAVPRVQVAAEVAPVGVAEPQPPAEPAAVAAGPVPGGVVVAEGRHARRRRERAERRVATAAQSAARAAGAAMARAA
jgi:hypothetical protein